MNYETLVYFSYSLESLAVLLCNFFLLWHEIGARFFGAFPFNRIICTSVIRGSLYRSR